MDGVKVTGIDGPNGLEILAADLTAAARDVLPEVRKVVQKGSLNIKRDWQRTWSGHPRIRGIVPTISYDTQQTADKVSSEIGPDPARRGVANLANLIEYEFGGIHSAPIPGGAPALAAEQPRFEKALGDVAEQQLQRRR